MRVIDQAGRTLESYDLENGQLVDSLVVRDGAEPVDNVKKFAYSDDDYERVKVYVENPVGNRERDVADLKRRLAETDYVAAKTADAIASCSTADELMSALASVREEYGGVLAERQSMRERINDLESGGTATARSRAAR